MKKYIAIFMCLIMILSLFSCDEKTITDNYTEDKSETEYKHTTSDDPVQKSPADYSKILDMYRSIIEILPNYEDSKEAIDNCCAELGIVDEKEKELFEKLFSSTFDFKKSPPYNLSCGYATKDLNGDGVDELVLLNNEYYIIAIFSYANGKPILLGNYMPRGSCWIDGDGLLHENSSGGADHSTNAIYKIGDGGKKLELIVEYGTNGHKWIEDVTYTVYYKLIDGEKTVITEDEYRNLDTKYGKYLGSVAGAEATKKYSGLTFTYLYTYTEAKIAMEMYEAALKNEIKVYETDIEKYNYLKNCKTPYNRLPLYKLESMRYVYMDVDGDSINELVIDCGDTLILRYYKGTVYVYSFTFRAMYHLNTDGSFSWNHNRQNFEYGENQLTFDGAELKTTELWRIVNDGKSNAEYYIADKQVTKEEILKYIEDNHKTKVEFSPLEVSWQKTISLEKALEIAAEYWYDCYSIKVGDKDSETGFPYAILPKDNDSENYCIALAWLVEGSHYSTLEMIEIDAFTGEIILPTYEPNGKG